MHRHTVTQGRSLYMKSLIYRVNLPSLWRCLTHNDSVNQTNQFLPHLKTSSRLITLAKTFPKQLTIYRNWAHVLRPNSTLHVQKFSRINGTFRVQVRLSEMLYRPLNSHDFIARLTIYSDCSHAKTACSLNQFVQRSGQETNYLSNAAFFKWVTIT